ncbi:MAG: hypothetical protein HONBIEJF_00331 [Fimbriimonadaceae bacterium]|nr:hypothetical protein [Fimbriimonadaceae bacterium]
MKEILGKAQTVRELLKDKRYSIDYYQREYKWQEKQIQELIDDLSDRFLEDYREGDAWSKVRDYGHYFLGSVIISDKGGLKFIVDGQQRITSLTILLIYLNNLQMHCEKKAKIQDLIVSEQYGDIAFNLDGGKDSERVPAFEALYKGDPFDATDRSESVRNIVQRYADIESCFPDELKEEALPLFIDWVADNVHLVEITAYSDDDAYTIFETMNDRGLSLTPSDMLKGYLLTNITDSQKREAASDRWKARIREIQELDRDAETDFSNKLEADFFKSWLRSQYSTKIRERKKGAKNEDFDRIGTEFHRWLRDQAAQVGLKVSDDFFQFINRDFDFFSRQFQGIVNASRLRTEGLEHIRYNAHHRFTLQNLVLLSSLKPTDSGDTVLRKLRLAGQYINILLAWRIWNYRATDYSTMQYATFNVMKDIRGLDPEPLAKVLYDKLTAEQENFPNNSYMHEAGIGLTVHQGNRKQLHCLLARITEYIELQSGMSSRYEEYMAEDGKNRYEVEHIWANMPERHAEEFPSPDEFRRHRNRFGGLLLLPKSFNASYGALPFIGETPDKSKRDHYFGQNLLAGSMAPLAYQNNPGFLRFIGELGLPFHAYNGFTRGDLDERCLLYQAIANRVWNPESLLQELNQ